jgi:peptidyl-prolyl cis-trans isomerase SurA
VKQIKDSYMRNTIATLLLAIALGSASAAGAEILSGIAAVVNDEIITIRELNSEYEPVAKEAEKREGPLSAEAAKKLKSAVLDSLIDKVLVRQKIKELKIVITPEELRQTIEEIKRQNGMSQEQMEAALLARNVTFDQYKTQLKEQLERVRLMSQEVKAKIQVSEREVREYYEANSALYTEETNFRARHIFLKIGKNAGQDEIRRVKEKAAKVILEAKINGDFAGLAKKYSDDPGAAKDGGNLGTFKVGDMLPEIERTILKMNPGEISEIVTTPAGLHIIKLEEKNIGRMKPLESVKASIEEILYKKKSEERFKQWAEELRKGATVEIKL